MTMLAKLAIAVLGLVGAVAPLSAQGAGTPLGLWQSDNGAARYELSLCGDGTQLCAKLVWLSEGDRTAENLPYLNTYLMQNANRVKANQWKGEAHLFGQSFAGTVTFIAADRIELSGCVLFVVCRTYYLDRYEG